jgi:hypothetical protein
LDCPSTDRGLRLATPCSETTVSLILPCWM